MTYDPLSDHHVPVPTPRTDALLAREPGTKFMELTPRLANLARELERDLAEARWTVDQFATLVDRAEAAEATATRLQNELAEANRQADEAVAHAERFAETLRNLGAYLDISTDRPAQELGDALIERIEVAESKTLAAEKALAEAVERCAKVCRDHADRMDAAARQRTNERGERDAIWHDASIWRQASIAIRALPASPGTGTRDDGGE